MKKVWVFSFLVFLTLICGCKSNKSDRNPMEENRPAVTRAGRSYYWDKDLRPTLTVPRASSSRPQTAMQPTEPVQPQSTSPVISEPVQPMTTPSESRNHKAEKPSH